MTLATLTGLTIALFGVLAVAAVTRACERTDLRNHVLAVAAIAVMLIAVLAIVVFWERRPLSSIGLVPPTLDGVFWGVGIAVAYIYLVGPILMAMPRWLGLKGFEQGLAQMVRLPGWYLALTIVIVGSTEEILFCGYAIERLSSVTGSVWLACLISAAASALAHVPVWGWGVTPPLLVSGLMAALLYVWFRDLTPLIVAHMTSDAVGILWPSISQGKKPA